MWFSNVFPLLQHLPPRRHMSATAIMPSEEGHSLWAEPRAGPSLKQDGCHVTCADRQMDLERASEHEIFISFCINLKPAASWETNRLMGPSSGTAILRSRATDPAMNTREHAHTHKTEGAGLQSYKKLLSTNNSVNILQMETFTVNFGNVDVKKEKIYENYQSQTVCCYCIFVVVQIFSFLSHFVRNLHSEMTCLVLADWTVTRGLWSCNMPWLKHASFYTKKMKKIYL